MQTAGKNGVDNLFAGIHCSVEDTVSPQHMSREHLFQYDSR